MTEEQKNYLKDISDPTSTPDERVDVYVPVFAGGEVIWDGNRRKHKNQHIRLNYIDVEDKNVLDIGCNTGYISFRLNEKGAQYVLGVDKDPKIIKVCNAIKEIDGVSKVDFVEYDKGFFDPAYLHVENPVLSHECFPFDVALTLSNFDLDTTVHELGMWRHYAKVWYLEPTNHHDHYKTKDEMKNEGLRLLSQFGDVEFLTYTDYQDRALFKLTVNN